jgi:mannose-6-phosphate isomerase-like protein (cupin superfamily)
MDVLTRRAPTMSESYTVMKAADAPDYTGDAPGAFIGYARPMDSEQLGVNVRVLEPGMAHVPPGEDDSAGHSHDEIEEIYFVLEGELTVKLGDDVLTLGPRDAVLIPPATVRGARNDGDADAALLMVSVKMRDPQGQSHLASGHWG